MWFLLGVLALWALTYSLAQVEAYAPPFVLWGLWTVGLYAPGLASMQSSWADVPARLCGVVGFTLFVAYVVLMFPTFYVFLPASPTSDAAPNLWAVVYTAVNLVGPVVVTTAGCLRSAVDTG